MEYFENEVDFGQLLLDMQELQKLLDDSAAKVSDPDAKVIVEQLSAMFRIGAEDFTREYPAMTANIESEISALQEKLASCAAQTPASSAAPQDAEREFAYDPKLGIQLRDDLLQRFGIKIQKAAAASSPAGAAPLEPFDFWSTSFSGVASIAPKPPEPSTSQPDVPNRPQSFESWIGRDSMATRDSQIPSDTDDRRTNSD